MFKKIAIFTAGVALLAHGGAFDSLKQWALRYVRHRDLPLKKIAEIKDADFGFVLANNDGTSTSCIIQVSLKDVNRDFISATAAATLVVTLSNGENIKAVYSMWDAVAACQSLLVIFVNPFSALEDKWLLRPYLHNKVCDRSSLLQGLKAMAELVEPIDTETLAVKMREHEF